MLVRDETTGAGSRQWQSGWASEMQSQMRACVRARLSVVIRVMNVPGESVAS